MIRCPQRHITHAVRPPSGGGPGFRLTFVDMRLRTRLMVPPPARKSGSGSASGSGSGFSPGSLLDLGLVSFSSSPFPLLFDIRDSSADSCRLAAASRDSCFSMSRGKSPSLELDVAEAGMALVGEVGGFVFV